MKKHFLAMVGFGGMAGWHYDLIEKIENLSVAGIWDIRKRDGNTRVPDRFLYMAVWKNS